MKETQKRQTFSFRLPVELVERLEKVIERSKGGLRNRTHALEIAIEDFIRKNSPTERS